MVALAEGSSSGPPSPLPPAPPLTYKRLVSSADTLAALPLFPSHVALWGGVVKLIIGIGVAGVWGVGLAIGARFSSLGGGLWVGAVVALSGFLSVCGARRPHSQVYLVSLLCVSALSLLASGLLLLLSVAATAADAGAVPPDFLMKMEWMPPPPASVPAQPSPLASLNAAVVVSATLCVLSAVDCIVSALCITIATRQLCRICVMKAGPSGRWRLSEGQSRKERLYRWLGQQKTIFPIGTATGGALRPGAPVPSVSHFVPLTESSTSPSMDDTKNPKTTGYFSHPSIAPTKLEAQYLPPVFYTPKLSQPTLMANERYSCANTPLKSEYQNTFAKFANTGNFPSKKRKFHERDFSSNFDTSNHQKIFRPGMRACLPAGHKDESSNLPSRYANKKHGPLSYSQSCLVTAPVRYPPSSGLRTPRSSAATSAILHRNNLVHPRTPAVSRPDCARSVAPSLHSFYSDPRTHFSLPYCYKGCATPQRYYSASEGYYALRPARRLKRDLNPRQGQVSSIPQAMYVAPSLYSWHYSTPLYSTMYSYAPEPRCSQAYGCPTQKSDRKRRRKERLRRRHTAAAHSSSSEKRLDANERRDKRRKCEELTDDQIDRTYTGLDRAIAEVFIDSTMQTSR